MSNTENSFEISFKEESPENLSVRVCHNDTTAESKEFDFIVDSSGIRLNEQLVKDDILLFVAAALRRISEKIYPEGNPKSKEGARISIKGDSHKKLWATANEFSSCVGKALDTVYSVSDDGDDNDEKVNQANKFIITDNVTAGFDYSSTSDKIKALEEFVSKKMEEQGKENELSKKEVQDRVDKIKEIFSKVLNVDVSDKSLEPVNLLKKLLGETKRHKIKDIGKEIEKKKQEAETAHKWIDNLWATEYSLEDEKKRIADNVVQKVKIEWMALLADKDIEDISEKEYEKLEDRFDVLSNKVSNLFAAMLTKVREIRRNPDSSEEAKRVSKMANVCVKIDIRTFVEHIQQSGEFTPKEQFLIACVFGDIMSQIGYIPSTNDLFTRKKQ